MASFYSHVVKFFTTKISTILAFGVICFLGLSMSALIIISYSDPSSLVPGIQTVSADISVPVTVPPAQMPESSVKEIIVSLKDQTLVYMEGDKIVGRIKISSGLARTPTPLGEYAVIKKKPAVNYRGPGYNYPQTKWNLMFKTGNPLNYYIHGAYWHNNFGKPMSHGCVNVSYADMEGLYNWADEGTKIIIQNESLDLYQYYSKYAPIMGLTAGVMTTDQSTTGQIDSPVLPQENSETKAPDTEAITTETDELMDGFTDLTETQNTISNLKNLLDTLEKELAD